MKRSRFSEEQIIGILKEAEAGRAIDDLVREHGIAEGTVPGPTGGGTSAATSLIQSGRAILTGNFANCPLEGVTSS
jgi:hypothetical protein